MCITWVVVRNHLLHYHHPSYLPKHLHLPHPHLLPSSLPERKIISTADLIEYAITFKKKLWINTLWILVSENWLVMWKLQSGKEHTKNCSLLNGMKISNKNVLDKSRNDLPSAGNSSNSSSSSNKPKSGFFSFSLPSLMLIFRSLQHAWSVKRFSACIKDKPVRLVPN